MPEVVKVGAMGGLEWAFQADTAIGGLTTGGYVVAKLEWFFSDLFNGDAADNLGTVTAYDALGNPVHSEIYYRQITGEENTIQFTQLDVIGTANGGYAVNFTYDRGLQLGVIYNASGVRLGTYGFGETIFLPDAVSQAGLSNGNIVLVEYDATGARLQAQIFNAVGALAGGVLDLNTAPVGPAAAPLPQPSTVALEDGGFAVAWTDRSALADGDNSGSAIKVRFFDLGGAALTGQVLVNTSTAGDQTDASSAKLASGNVIVVWTDKGGNGGDAGAGIKAQMFTAAGIKTGAEFRVNTTTAGNQQTASVAVLSNGAFVVVWEDRNPGTDDNDGCIRGQLFSAAGVKLGSEFLVNTPALGAQADPEVIALAGGKFLVKWAYGFDRLTQTFDTSQFDFPDPVITTLSGSATFEYAANGTVIGTVAASDTGPLTYSLANDAGGRFSIGAANGVISVADGLGLDFEQAASHVIRVRVEDGDGHSVEKDFTIHISNRAPETLVGDDRANTLYGGAGTDVFVGGEGNDLLNGGLGTDITRGGLGDDRYYVDNAGDQVIEIANQGNDSVFTTVSYALAAGFEIEVLRTGNVAGTSNLNLTGNGYANTILGNAGNNRIDGGVGADDMKGGGGNDLYYVDNGGDKVTELAGGGIDTVTASVSYSLAAGVHVETLQTSNAAGTGAINLTGNELANVIRGNAGINSLRGNGGADDIFAGMDSLRDTIVFSAASDSTVTAFDQVYNFDKANFAGIPAPTRSVCR